MNKQFLTLPLLTLSLTSYASAKKSVSATSDARDVAPSSTGRAKNAEK